MAIFGLKTAILDFKVASELHENIFIWTALKSYASESSFIRFRAFLLRFQGSSHTAGSKNAIFGLKTAILDFKVASELSENIFIWTASKSYTSESSFIRFRAFLLWFQGSSHTVGFKNGYFWPENGHIRFQSGLGAFLKYFYLIGIEKLYKWFEFHPLSCISTMVSGSITHCRV